MDWRVAGVVEAVRWAALLVTSGVGPHGREERLGRLSRDRLRGALCDCDLESESAL